MKVKLNWLRKSSDPVGWRWVAMNWKLIKSLNTETRSHSYQFKACSSRYDDWTDSSCALSSMQVWWVLLVRSEDTIYIMKALITLFLVQCIPPSNWTNRKYSNQEARITLFLVRCILPSNWTSNHKHSNQGCWDHDIICTEHLQYSLKQDRYSTYYCFPKQSIYCFKLTEQNILRTYAPEYRHFSPRLLQSRSEWLCSIGSASLFLLVFSFLCTLRMSRKKCDNPDATIGTQPPKRSKAVSGFRVCRPSTSELPSRNISTVTTLKQNKGRTGQRKEDHVHQRQEESSPADLVLTTSQSELQIDPTPFDPTSDHDHLPCPSVNTSSKLHCERSNKNAVSPFLLLLEFSLISNQPKLMEWIGYRDSCLDELLWQDAPSDLLGQPACGTCGKEEGVFKCKDCLTGCQLRCQGCIISTHQDHPLHHFSHP